MDSRVCFLKRKMLMLPMFYATILVSDELVFRSVEDFGLNFGFIGSLHVKIGYCHP
jgi:hypothetical protein